MKTDAREKQQRLLAEKKEIDTRLKHVAAEAAYESLLGRHNGGRKPSRVCLDLLPERYGETPKVNMKRDAMSISVFVNLAHFLSRQDILKLVEVEESLTKATQLLSEQPLPSSWSDCLRDWIISSPHLVREFFGGRFNLGKM